jgi:capsular polysaccharide biosynthesis protein
MEPVFGDVSSTRPNALQVQIQSSSVLHTTTGIVWDSRNDSANTWSLGGLNKTLFESVREQYLDNAPQVHRPVFLAYNNNYNNAYHVLLEWTRALFTYRELNLASSGCQILLPASHSGNKYVRAVLEFTGLSRYVLWVNDLDDKNYLKFNQMIIPKCLYSDGFDYKYPPFLSNWFADLRLWILRDAVQSRIPERIYISRSDSKFRVMENERSVEDFVACYGFTVLNLSNLTLVETVAMFSSSRIVVGPHGAGLSNLVFRRGPRTVVELMPETYVNPCFKIISDAAGDEHQSLFMEEIESSQNHRQRVFKADLQHIRQTLADL